jgi:hypothetical protein
MREGFGEVLSHFSGVGYNPQDSMNLTKVS